MTKRKDEIVEEVLTFVEFIFSVLMTTLMGITQKHLLFGDNVGKMHIC